MKRRHPQISFVHSPRGLGQEDLPLKHLPNTFQPIFLDLVGFAPESQHVYVWCCLNEEGFAEFHQSLVISAVIREGLCKPGRFSELASMGLFEDDDKQGKKNPL